MIPAATLGLIAAVSYVLAYVATWTGAEAAHLARLLASVPADPSPSQAQLVAMSSGELQDRADAMRCEVCGRPGMVRHYLRGAASVTVQHRKSCPHHPAKQRRTRS